MDIKHTSQTSSQNAKSSPDCEDETAAGRDGGDKPKVEMSFLEWQRSRKTTTTAQEQKPNKTSQRKVRQIGKQQQQQQPQKPMPLMLPPPPPPPMLMNCFLNNNNQNHNNNFRKNYHNNNNNSSNKNNFHSNNFNSNIMRRNYSSFCDDDFDEPGFNFRPIPNMYCQLNAYRPGPMQGYGGRPPPPPRHQQQQQHHHQRFNQKPTTRKNATPAPPPPPPTAASGTSSAGNTAAAAKKSVTNAMPAPAKKPNTTTPIPGTAVNNSETNATEKTKTPQKYPRLRGMVRPQKPPVILPTTQEEKEEKKRLWREYRQAMKPFKNRDFANAKRVIQRLGKKARSEMDELDRERYDKAMELITVYKKKLSEKAASRWICASDGGLPGTIPEGTAASSTSDTKTKAQIYIRKPIVPTYNVPPPPVVNNIRPVTSQQQQQQYKPYNGQQQQQQQYKPYNGQQQQQQPPTPIQPQQQPQTFDWSSSSASYYNATTHTHTPAPTSNYSATMHLPTAPPPPSIDMSNNAYCNYAMAATNPTSVNANINNYIPTGAIGTGMSAVSDWATTAAKESYGTTSYEFDKLMSSLPNYATNSSM